MQRLRHRLQGRARRSLGREPAPRRHPQRRRGGRAQHLGRLHALLRRALHGGLPGRLLLPHRGRRGPARQGRLHRLRLLLLRLPVRRAAVSVERHLRPARQDGQVHLLRRRPGGQRQRGRERQVRAQPPRRGQASGLRRDVLDQGAARRRRRRRRRHLPHPCASTAARAARSGAGARPTANRRTRQGPGAGRGKKS